jgi:hypothetical protein
MVAAWSNVVEQRVQPPAPGHSSLETMTQQDYSNDLVFRSGGEEYARIYGNGPWKSVAPSTELEVASNDGFKVGGNMPPANITFNIGKPLEEIARFTEEGFYYKGEFIDDAGLVYQKMHLVLNKMRDESWMGLCARLLQAVDAGNKDAEELVLCQIRVALKE